MSSDAGKLCRHYTALDLALVYKKGGDDAGKLIYKVDKGEETTITFAWDITGKDLDICAFWEEASGAAYEDKRCGFEWGATRDEWLYPNTKIATIDGVNYITSYSGDIKGEDNAEWVKVKKSRWSTGSNNYLVYLNFYGYDATSHPATTCTVIASQLNGPTFMTTANCGTNTGHKADPAAGDPHVTIYFDDHGKLLGFNPPS